MLGIYWFKQVSFVAKIKIHLVRLLIEDGSEANVGTSQNIWGQTKFEIMQRCRRKHKLLPSSTFCRGIGNRAWINVFRVEEVFEIKTGK
jgi:hypothetical protein